MTIRILQINILTLVIILCSGCATVNHTVSPPVHHKDAERYGVLQNLSLSSSEDKVLSLYPNVITEKDIEEVLSRYPAPRIIYLDGSIPIITMDSFSKFLISMGYPEERVRNPKNGSATPFTNVSLRMLRAFYFW